MDRLSNKGPLMLLPEKFAEWEGFVSAWCLPDTHARFQARYEGDSADLRHFYDSLMPRVEEALAYLDDFTIEAIDRKSVVSGQSVSVRVDTVGSRIINKKLQSLHIYQ